MMIDDRQADIQKHVVNFMSLVDFIEYLELQKEDDFSLLQNWERAEICSEPHKKPYL